MPKRKHEETIAKPAPAAAAKISDGDTLFSTRKLRSASRTWAESDGIHAALKTYFKESVHIIDPNMGAIFSPFESNQGRAYIAATNFAKALVGYTSHDNTRIDNGIIRSNAPLTKPIIAIMNTDSLRPEHKSDTKAMGGVHWVTLVILPKNYKTPKGASIHNANEKIYLIDSLDPKRKPPETLKKILTKGDIQEEKSAATGTDNTLKVRRHLIAAAFPNADFEELPNFKVQQVGTNDCGWWAIDNARQIVETGSAASIIEASQKGPRLATALREEFPGLDNPVVADHKLKH